MKWIDTEDALPKFSNNYVVSITRDNYTFLAIAEYDDERNQWFYSIKGEKDELIKDRINGWFDNVGVFLK